MKKEGPPKEPFFIHARKVNLMRQEPWGQPEHQELRERQEQQELRRHPELQR